MALDFKFATFTYNVYVLETTALQYLLNVPVPVRCMSTEYLNVKTLNF